MNRLRDQIGKDPVEEAGIALLQQTPPAPEMTELKWRVWMSIQRSASGVAGERGEQGEHGWASGAKLSGRPRVRMAALATAIVCGAGSAWAVIGQGWLLRERRQREQAFAPSVQSPAAPARTSRRPPNGHGADSQAEPAPEPPSAPQVVADTPITELRPRQHVPSKSSLPSAAKGLRRRLASTRAGRADAPSSRKLTAAPVTQLLSDLPATRTAATAERAEVLEAMIALRRDHDPSLAGALLDRYLVAHPRGVLHEEALVLAIEAAGERHDREAARNLARRYLTQHPQGRFSQFARALSESDQTSDRPAD